MGSRTLVAAMPTCVPDAMMSRCPGPVPKVRHSRSPILREAASAGSRDDVALPGASSKGAAQQVADLARGGERRLVPGGLIVADEADEVVLVHPHIPACPALIVEVRAQVAVGKLRGEQRAHHAVHQGLEPFVAGIEPGVGGGVQELAGVLADPILLAGALLQAFEDALFVYVKQASFQVDAHAIAQQSLHALAGIDRKSTRLN